MTCSSGSLDMTNRVTCHNAPLKHETGSYTCYWSTLSTMMSMSITNGLTVLVRPACGSLWMLLPTSVCEASLRGWEMWSDGELTVLCCRRTLDIQYRTRTPIWTESKVAKSGLSAEHSPNSSFRIVRSSNPLRPLTFSGMAGANPPTVGSTVSQHIPNVYSYNFNKLKSFHL